MKKYTTLHRPVNGFGLMIKKEEWDILCVLAVIYKKTIKDKLNTVVLTPLAMLLVKVHCRITLVEPSITIPAPYCINRFVN